MMKILWLEVVLLVLCQEVMTIETDQFNGPFGSMLERLCERRGWFCRFVDEGEEPTPAPSIVGCRVKRVRVSHICNLPDLDGEGDDEMALKLLVNDALYWPMDVNSDCDEDTWYDFCEISDHRLMGQETCYELPNPTLRTFINEPVDTTLTITLQEWDWTFDDYEYFYLSGDQWLDPTVCGNTEQIVYHASNGAYVKLTVISEEQVPTPMPSMQPSPQPTNFISQPPSPVPSAFLSSSPTTQCRFDYDDIEPALDVMNTELGAVSSTLADFAEASSNNNIDRRHRDLLWGALVRGVTRFTSTVIKRASQEGPLSSIADICTIGSTIFTFGFGAGDDEGGPDNSELFAQVFERFDKIDQKLDELSEQMKDGFDRLEALIKQEFADLIMDEWILNRLATLDENYRAYMHPEHTDQTRIIHETTFRNSCNENHPPTAIFRVLYSHACRACDLFSGQSNQYILDAFVGSAIQLFPDNVGQRIDWFRSNFAAVMISAMTQTAYLHTVCLYQPATVCQNEDPTWRDRLDAMSDGLDEVALAVSQAEERLKCRIKKVRVTQICDVPDHDTVFDSTLELRIVVDGRDYWPLNTNRDCPSGAFLRGDEVTCLISDELVINGACYSPPNSATWTFDAAKFLRIRVEDVDTFWWGDENRDYDLAASEWYDDHECGTRDIVKTNPEGGRINVRIVSEVLNEPWG